MKDSEASQGLPCSPARAREPRLSVRPSEASSADGGTPPRPHDPVLVLVVDDDADGREALRLLLEDAGYAVREAADGRAALEQIAGGLSPALILLDLLMPVMTGWTLWDELQLDPRWREIPVFVMTASGLRTGALGATPVFAKPIDVDNLLSQIAAVVAKTAR